MAQTSIPDALTVAIAGAKADASYDSVRSFVNEEASAEIPFGVVVCQGTADDGAKLPATSDAVLVGLVLHSNSYEISQELGTTGVKPKCMLNVMDKGRAWVLVEEAVTPADRAYVRYASGLDGTQKGALRATAVSLETIDATGQIRFLTSAGAGELAQVEIDMQNLV